MADHLPAAPWTRRADLARLVAALGADNIRWVGGAVRDTLLGVDVHDIDAATPLVPDEVIRRLEAAGLRHALTGLAHGTITAILPAGTVEVTTLRRDVATDGRRATIAFANDWAEDAARRDFTINALYAHPETLEISDYFGGLADLAARRVRFIGLAEQRIAEDHLRILRYYRFQARFGADLDAAAERACAALAPTLKGLSRERVGWEVLALLALPDPAPTVARMHAAGVLPVVLPETHGTELAALAALVAAEQAAGAAPDPIRRLAALLPPVPALAETIAARLRLSKAQREGLTCLAARTPADADNPRILAYRTSVACARGRLLLAGADIAALDGWAVPELPLKGGEIVALTGAAGPAVARTLRAVEERWLAEGFPARERVLQILRDVHD